MTLTLPGVIRASSCTGCGAVLPTSALTVHDGDELCMACWSSLGLPWSLWSPEVA